MNVKDYNQKVKYYFNCAILYFFCKKPHFFVFTSLLNAQAELKLKRKFPFLYYRIYLYFSLLILYFFVNLLIL